MTIAVIVLKIARRRLGLRRYFPSPEFSTDINGSGGGGESDSLTGAEQSDAHHHHQQPPPAAPTALH